MWTDSLKQKPRFVPIRNNCVQIDLEYVWRVVLRTRSIAAFDQNRCHCPVTSRNTDRFSIFFYLKTGSKLVVRLYAIWVYRILLCCVYCNLTLTAFKLCKMEHFSMVPYPPLVRYKKTNMSKRLNSCDFTNLSIWVFIEQHVTNVHANHDFKAMA